MRGTGVVGGGVMGTMMLPLFLVVTTGVSSPPPPQTDPGGALNSALVVSPAGDWGIYGSSVINLRSGGVHPLPSDWVTSCLRQDGAFGTTGGRVVTVGADGRLGPGAPGAGGVAVPSAPGAGSSVPPVAVATWPTSHPAGPSPVEGPTGVGVALVVAQDGPSTSVYAGPALGFGGDGR